MRRFRLSSLGLFLRLEVVAPSAEDVALLVVVASAAVALPLVVPTEEDVTGGRRLWARRGVDRERILCLVFSSRSIPLETDCCDDKTDPEDD